MEHIYFKFEFELAIFTLSLRSIFEGHIHIYCNLSVTLNQSGIGGFLGDSLVNHICYMLTTYVLLHLVHLGCNIFWICIACMLLTINYLTMQRNHFLYVLNQIELKLNHQTLHGEKKLFHL